MLVTTQPQETEAGQFVAGNPVVTLYDIGDNPVNGVDITISEVGGYSIDAGTYTVTTDINGEADFSDLVIEQAGNYTLSFDADDGAAPGVPNVTSDAFDVIPGAPDHLSVLVQPGDTIQNRPLSGPVSVALYDAFNNGIPSVDITATINKNTLNGTTTVTTNSSGVAGFSTISVDVGDTGYELTFDANDVDAPGVPDVTSNTFEIFTELGTLTITNQPVNSVVGNPIEGTDVINSPAVLLENMSGNPISGASITAYLSGGNFDGASTVTVQTDASGYAYFDALIINSIDAGYQITYSTGTNSVANATTNTFDVLASTGTMTLTQQPTESIEGIAVDGPPTVYIENSGSPISGVDITAFISKNSFNGTSQVTVQTNGSGLAVFDNLIIDDLDTDYQISFSAAQPGVSSLHSALFDVVEEVAILTVLQQPTLTIAGEDINGPPSVQLTMKGSGDPPGTPVNVTAYINKNGFNGASTIVADATPGNNGIATFDNLIIDDADTDYEILFSTNSSGIADVTTNLFEVIPVAGTMTISTQPSETIENKTISGPPTITILDPSLNPIQNISVEATINQNSFASGTTTLLTNASGEAVFNDLMISDVANDYQITFNVDVAEGVVSKTSNNFDVVDEIAIITVQTQPSLTIAGEVINGPPSVLIEDAVTGDPISGATIQVSVNKGSIAGGTTTVNSNASGIATFNDLVINADDTGYELIFGTGTSGIADVSSSSFDVISKAGEITVTQQPQETVDGYVVEGPPAIEIMEIDGITPMAGIQVTATINQNSFTVGSTVDVTTNASGVAVFDNLMLDQAADNYEITFTTDVAEGIPHKTTALFDVVDEVAVISVQTQPQLTIAGENINGPPSVLLETPGGNPVAGGTIYVTLNQSSFNGSSTTSATTNASGIATFDNLIIDDANTGYELTFSSGSSGIAPQTSNAFEIADPSGVMVISQQPQETVDGESIAGPPTITLEETNGDPWAGGDIDVTVSVNKNGFTGGTITQTTSGGVAAFDDLVLDAVDQDYELNFTIDISERIANKTSNQFDVVSVTGNLAVTLQPSETVAGDPINGPPTVKLTNLSGNPVPGVDITATLNKSAFNGSSTVTVSTDADGNAVFSNIIIDDFDTDYAITFSAAASGIADVTSDLFEVTDALLNMTVTTQPQQTVAGNAVVGHPAVTVDNGSPISGVSVTATINKNGFATGSTITEITDGSGIATFDDLIINTAATGYQITFNADYSGVPNAQSVSFEVVHGSADDFVVDVEPQNTTAGEVLQGPPAVTLIDAFGNPVDGENITVTPNQHSIASGTTTIVSDANGQAVFNDLVINTAADNYQLFFTATGASGSSGNFIVSNAPADNITVTTQPSETVAGAAINGPPLVSVEDAFGNPVSGETITITEEGGYSLDAGTLSVETSATGDAEFPDLVISTEGTGYQLRFTVDGIFVVSDAFNIVPGTIFSRFYGGSHAGYFAFRDNGHPLGQTPDRIEIATQPQESVVGTTVVGPPQIIVYDSYNEPVADVSVTVSGPSFSSGTLALTSDEAGYITFSDLAIDSKGTYNLTFTADEYPAVNITSNAFDVIDALATMSMSVQPQETTAGQTIAGVPTVSIENSIGMPIQGIDITVYINQFNFSAGTMTVQTDENGLAAFNDLVINEAAQNYQLIFDADYSGVQNITSNNFNVTNAAADAINILTQPTETFQGATLEGPPTVQVVDVYGNAVSGVDVSVTEILENGIDAGITTISTDSDGLAAFSTLVINDNGTFQLSFSAAGVADETSNTFPVVPGTVANRFKGSTHSGFGNSQTQDKLLGQTPVRMEVLTQPLETVAGFTIEGPPAIAIYDAINNPVPNIQITVTAIGGSFNGGTFTRNSDEQGIVTFNDLVINTPGTYHLSFSADNHTSTVDDISSNNFNVVDQVYTMEIDVQPQNSTAGQNIAGAPKVSIKNFINQPLEGVDVTVYINQFDFASGTITMQTDANGEAEFNDLVITEAATGYQLIFDADYSGISNVNSNLFEVSYASPDNLTVVTQPGETSEGAAVSGPPTVQLRDIYNNPIPNGIVSVSESGGYVFDAGTTSQTTNENGLTTFGDLIINTVGSYSLVFSQADVSDETSQSFNVQSGTVANRFKGSGYSGFSQFETTNKELGQTPTRIEVLTEPQETVLGLVVEGPPSIVVYDEMDNTVANVDVTVSVPGGFEVGSSAELTTNADGEITFDNLLIGSTGNYQLSYAADDYPAVTAQSATFDVVDQQLFMTVTTEPSETIAGQPIAGHPTVKLANSIDQGYQGISVTVYLNQYEFSSGVATQTVVTDASGFAEFDQLTIDQAAEGFQLLFDADYTGVLNVNSASFNVVNGPVDHLAMQTEPEDTESGASILGPPTVVAYDAFSNPVSSVNISVAETGGYGFDAGTTTATTDSDGLASFSDLVINTMGAYSLTFSATGVDDLVSGTFNILSGTISYRFKGNTHSGFSNRETTDKKLGQTPTRIEIVTQPAETIVSNPIEGPPAVIVYDEVDNPVAGINIEVSVDGFFDSGTLQVVTDENGQAVFSDLVMGSTGTYTLQFNAPAISALPDATSNSFDVVNQMLQATIITQPQESQAGIAVVGFPAVKLENDFGQGFQGVDITAYINQFSYGGASTTTVTTDASGVATFDNLILEKAAQNYQIIFEIDYTGVNNISSGYFDVVAGPASQMTVLVQPEDGLAEAAIGGAPSVALSDAYNNPIGGTEITVSETGGYVFDGGTTSLITDAGGVVTFSDLVINTAGTYTLNFSTAGGVPDVQSDAFNILPGNIADRFKGGSESGYISAELSNELLQQVPTRIEILTQPLESTVSTPIQGPPLLKVYDQNDLPINGTAVTATVLGGTPSLSGATTVTSNALGEILFNNISIAQTGTFQLHFEVAGYPAVSINSQQFDVITQTLAIAIDQQPLNTQAGEIINGHPSVAITNEIGQPAPAGIDVVVYTNQSDFSSDPSFHTVQTNASGIAVFDQLVIDVAADDYQLIFEPDYPGLSTITSDVFAITPAPANYMQVTTQPGDGEAGSTIPGYPGVGIYDAFGNPVSGIDIDIAESGAEPLTGTTSVTSDQNGESTYSDLVISNPGTYQLVFNANAAGVADITSNNFNLISTGTVHRFKGGSYSGYISSVITDQPLTEPPEVEIPVFTVFEATLCQGTQNTQYTAEAANNDSIRYDISITVAGTINDETGLLDLQADFYGEFYVRATAYGYQGPKTDSVKVVVNANIDAPVFTDPVLEVCQGGTETYVATAVHTNTIAYSMSPPESGSIDAGTGEMIWAADFNGTTQITATAGEVGDCGGQQQTTISVTVNPEVETPVFTQGATELCQGSPNEIYQATAANADSVIYSRSPSEAGNIDINTGEMSWNPDFSGTAVITARAKGSCNGDKDETRTVTIRPKPSTSIISGPNNVVCNAVGESYSVTLNTGADYAWTVPSGAAITSGAAGPENNEIVVDFAENNGFIRVTETSQYGCVGDEEELQVTLFGCNLAANFEASETTTCEGNTVVFTDLSTGNVDTWQWDFGAGAVPQTATGAGPHTVEYTTVGTYSVELIVSEQSLDDTETKVDYITVGQPGTWLGALNSSWFESQNWSCGVIPDAGETPFNVVISASAPNNPTISGVGARVQNIEIESGATLNVAAGSAIDVYGDWQNDGAFNFGTSTIVFRGDNSQIKGNNETTFYNLRIIAGKQLTSESGNININGNFDADGTFVHNSGSVTFNGVGDQQITGDNASLVFNDLIVDKSSGDLTFSRAADVAGALTLTEGIVYTTNANLLTLLNGSTSNEGSNTAFVDGPIRKNGTGAFTFPTGNNGIWAPLQITDPGNAGDGFTAQYFSQANANADRPCSSCDGDILYVSGVEYWDLQRVAGASTPDVTLHIKDMARSGISDLGDLLFAHWNGAIWNNMTLGTTSLGANACSVTGTGFSSYSPMAPASSMGVNPLPVELLRFEAWVSDEKVNLEWETGSETNNDYFTIEKTTDGELFETVTTVQGSGNSSVPREYSCTDYSPLVGSSYYRLSQTDFDGQTEFFPMIEVYYEKLLQTPHLQVFPNPAQSHNYNIRVNNIENTTFELTIFDDLGNRLYSSQFSDADNDGYILLTPDRLQLQLKQGLYFINIQSKHYQLRKKMIIY